MNTKDIRKKNMGELGKDLADKTKALVDIAFGNAGSKNKNTKMSRNLRKEIAQIRTVIREMKA